jgi:2-keto-4-pentenoate hydratase/2-oxohepta-3-ene-1,7-dioic acid hydratase in catechol pathway
MRYDTARFNPEESRSMKLGRISRAGLDGPTPRLVAVHPTDGRVVDLASAERLRLEADGATAEAARRLSDALFPPSMSEAIALGRAFTDAAERADATAADEATLAIGDVQWIAALDPPVIRDSLTFPLHMKQYGERLGVGAPNPQLFRTPGYFKGSTGVVYGHDEEIPYPSFAQKLDYELELGFVVGRVGRDLDPEAAERLLFGVTVFNDFSARDIQGPEMRLGLGPTKSKDFASALGPWVTTIDEVDVRALEMIARVNGEEWSRGSSSSMIWTPGELVAYISQGDELHPGDVIGSGTAPRGSALELGRKLSPGDEVELEVTGVGVLRNVVGAKQPSGWSPPKKEPKIFGKSAA